MNRRGFLSGLLKAGAIVPAALVTHSMGVDTAAEGTTDKIVEKISKKYERGQAFDTNPPSENIDPNLIGKVIKGSAFDNSVG